MIENSANKGRRDALKTLITGLATVPVVHLLASAEARAQEWPPVNASTHLMARALGFTHDATTVDRSRALRPGLPFDQQFCRNCSSAEPYPEPGWRSCYLYPQHKVSERGWCANWALANSA